MPLTIGFEVNELIKRLILLIATLLSASALLFVISLPAANRAFYTNDIKYGAYNIIASGPISYNLFQQWVNTYGQSNIAGSFSVRTQISKENKKETASVLFCDDLSSFSDISYYSPALVQWGQMSSGQAIVSFDLMKKLKINPGDEIIVYMNDKTYSIPVSGIFQKTANICNRIILEKGNIVIPNSNKVQYTSVFMRIPNAEQKTMIANNTSTNPIKVRTKDALLLKGETIYKTLKKASIPYILGLLLMLSYLSFIYFKLIINKKQKLVFALTVIAGSFLITYSIYYNIMHYTFQLNTLSVFIRGYFI